MSVAEGVVEFFWPEMPEITLKKICNLHGFTFIWPMGHFYDAGHYFEEQVKSIIYIIPC